MNLPRRFTDAMVRPTSRAASCLRLPGVTCFEVNSAATMRRPGKCGVSERTTDSTSGSSGTTFLARRQIYQHVVALGLDAQLHQHHRVVEIVHAVTSIVHPG